MRRGSRKGVRSRSGHYLLVGDALHDRAAGPVDEISSLRFPLDSLLDFSVLRKANLVCGTQLGPIATSQWLMYTHLREEMEGSFMR